MFKKYKKSNIPKKATPLFIEETSQEEEVFSIKKHLFSNKNQIRILDEIQTSSYTENDLIMLRHESAISNTEDLPAAEIDDSLLPFEELAQNHHVDEFEIPSADAINIAKKQRILNAKLDTAESDFISLNESPKKGYKESRLVTEEQCEIDDEEERILFNNQIGESTEFVYTENDEFEADLIRQNTNKSKYNNVKTNSSNIPNSSDISTVADFMARLTTYSTDIDTDYARIQNDLESSSEYLLRFKSDSSKQSKELDLEKDRFEYYEKFRVYLDNLTDYISEINQEACDARLKTKQDFSSATNKFINDFIQSCISPIECPTELPTFPTLSLPQHDFFILKDFSIQVIMQKFWDWKRRYPNDFSRAHGSALYTATILEILHISLSTYTPFSDTSIWIDELCSDIGMEIDPECIQKSVSMLYKKFEEFNNEIKDGGLGFGISNISVYGLLEFGYSQDLNTLVKNSAVVMYERIRDMSSDYSCDEMFWGVWKFWRWGREMEKWVGRMDVFSSVYDDLVGAVGKCGCKEVRRHALEIVDL